jgi:Na+/phosphate symporter
MKGWITLLILAGILYYLLTETTQLDKPISQAEELVIKIHRKLDAMTGTKIIKMDKKVANLKADIAARLSTRELEELNQIVTSPENLEEFKDKYCNLRTISHPVFNKDNLEFICDKL